MYELYKTEYMKFSNRSGISRFGIFLIGAQAKALHSDSTSYPLQLVKTTADGIDPNASSTTVKQHKPLITSTINDFLACFKSTLFLTFFACIKSANSRINWSRLKSLLNRLLNTMEKVVGSFRKYLSQSWPAVFTMSLSLALQTASIGTNRSK
ncbi:hypothetical protein DOY81_011889 [Sarcophaga bullata]|nr:hypothetical protein DOY81_011889 [Sarcophaga bullata]